MTEVRNMTCHFETRPRAFR